MQIASKADFAIRMYAPDDTMILSKVITSVEAIVISEIPLV